MRKRRKNKISVKDLKPIMKDLEIGEAIKIFLHDCKIRNLSLYTIQYYIDHLIHLQDDSMNLKSMI
jgi:hypothetical protein